MQNCTRETRTWQHRHTEASLPETYCLQYPDSTPLLILAGFGNNISTKLCRLHIYSYAHTQNKYNFEEANEQKRRQVKR